MAETGELRRFDLIHIAAHAFTDKDHPERSALVLSQVDKSDPVDVIMNGKPAFDGFISAEEIVRQFEFDPRLVALSACRTTMANAPGEGFLDLAHAFLLSGARSVLVSLWNVGDDATSLLMGRFYENLTGAHSDDRGAAAPATPMGKADALKEARKWLCDYEDDAGNRPFQHPAYWAGFVLIGGLN
jgi:CHAT domain-containing protein